MRSEPRVPAAPWYLGVLAAGASVRPQDARRPAKRAEGDAMQTAPARGAVCRRCIQPAVLAILLLNARPGVAAADTPIRAALGYDYSSGPGGVVSRGILGIAALGLGDRGLATAAVTRFDDGQVGTGTGVTGGLAIAAGSSTFLRAWASRYTGEASYSAWRLKAGPQLGLPHSAKLGLYYAHDEDNAATRSNALAAEFDVPIVEDVTGRASASYARQSGGMRGGQGTV